MISITRAQAKLLRTILRKSAPADAPRKSRPPILLQANEQGLRACAHYYPAEVAIEWRRAGPCPSDTLVFPGHALDHFEGAQNDVVELTFTAPDELHANWLDHGMPRRREYATVTPDKVPATPVEPANFVSMDGPLLKALDDASQTAARLSTRVAMNRLQLRGKNGTIVSTDGKQLLVQRGFRFPWKDDVLIPPLGAFGCRELLGVTPVAIARTDKHVCIRIGPWTFHLGIDRDARFPNWERSIPSFVGRSTAARFHADDTAFLTETLLSVPSGESDEGVTIDLNGHVAIRAKQEGDQRATELLLARSECTGPPVRVASNRQLLARAFQLGFSEFHVTTPDVPIVARDSRRLYMWMPYHHKTILLASEDTIRVSSTQDVPDASVPDHHPEPPRSNPMAAPSLNGHPANRVPESNGSPPERNLGIVELIAEAESLRAVLADASNRTARLLSALKQHRRQSKAVQQAMQSLKQLQLDG